MVAPDRGYLHARIRALSGARKSKTRQWHAFQGTSSLKSRILPVASGFLFWPASASKPRSPTQPTSWRAYLTLLSRLRFDGPNSVRIRILLQTARAEKTLGRTSSACFGLITTHGLQTTVVMFIAIGQSYLAGELMLTASFAYCPGPTPSEPIRALSSANGTCLGAALKQDNIHHSNDEDIISVQKRKVIEMALIVRSWTYSRYTPFVHQPDRHRLSRQDIK